MERIRSLADLRTRAAHDERYARLAMVAAHNLGGPAHGPRGDLKGALRWLELNAAEVDERSLVDEVNSCRDLVLEQPAE